MGMTNAEAFRFGFINRCIERGLSTGQIKDAAEKAALFSFQDLKSIAMPALGIAALTPPALGLAAGYGTAALGDVDDTDVKDVQHQELLSTYKTETDRLRHQKAWRDFRNGRLTVG